MKSVAGEKVSSIRDGNGNGFSRRSQVMMKQAQQTAYQGCGGCSNTVDGSRRVTPREQTAKLDTQESWRDQLDGMLTTNAGT